MTESTPYVLHTLDYIKYSLDKVAPTLQPGESLEDRCLEILEMQEREIVALFEKGNSCVLVEGYYNDMVKRRDQELLQEQQPQVLYSCNYFQLIKQAGRDGNLVIQFTQQYYHDVGVHMNKKLGKTVEHSQCMTILSGDVQVLLDLYVRKGLPSVKQYYMQNMWLAYRA